MPKRATTFLLYSAMLGAAVGVFLWIRSVGETLVALLHVVRQAVNNTPSESAGVLTHVLLALVVIILCARALGMVFRRFNQPPVIGEMIAGIRLGPSLLGRVLPGVSAYILPGS